VGLLVLVAVAAVTIYWQRATAIMNAPGPHTQSIELEVKPGARVRFSAASTLHVTGRVLVGNGAEVKPTAASGVLPHDVVLYAGGTDGPPNNPGDAIAIGSNAVVGINAYAPSGTLSVGSYANATGAFVGRRVLVGSNVVFRKDSVFVCP